MTSKLSSRERVRLALNHREPDRVPIDITWTKVPYAAARRALGLPDEELKPVAQEARDRLERVAAALEKN